MKQTSFFEEKLNLPEELIGVDIEPDKLPEIKVDVDDTTMNYIIITYETGESTKLNELAGISFLRNHINTYRFTAIKDGSGKVPEWVNDSPNYIILLFEKEDLEQVLKTFHIGNYKKGEIFKYKLDTIYNRQVLL